MKNKAFFFIVIAYVLIALVFGVYVKQNTKRMDFTEAERALLDELGTIVLVGDSGFPPLSFTDSSGQYSGYEADLASAIETKLGIPVEFKQTIWREAVDALYKGEVVGITGMRITDERAQVINFTRPYWRTAQAIITLQNVDYKEALAKEEVRVVVQEGSATYDYFNDRYYNENIEYHFVDEPRDAFHYLLNGAGDLWVENQQVARYEALKARLSGALSFHILPDSLGDYAIAVGPDYSFLVPIFNKALLALERDGTLTALDRIWFGLADIRDTTDSFFIIFPVIIFIFITLVVLVLLWNQSLQIKVNQKTEEHRLLLDNIPVQIWYLQEPETYGLVNQAHAQFLGFTSSQLYGKKLTGLPLLHEEKLSFIENNKESFKLGVSTFKEEAMHDCHGNKRVLRVTRTPVLTGDKVSYVVCTGVDITGQRRSKEALATEKKKLAVTLTSIGDAVITTDTAGRVVLLNEVAEKLTGWSQTEARDRNICEVFHIINEKTKEHVESPVTQALQHGYVIGLANNTLLITRDGQERPISDSAAPIKDEQGNILGVVLVFRDVAAEREAKRMLQETNELLNALIKGSPLAIIAMDQEGRVQRWNKAAERFFGWREKEVLGRENPLSIKEYHIETLKGKTFTNVEQNQICKDNKEVVISFSMAPLYGAKENITGSISVIADISEQVVAWEALRKNEEKYRVTFDNTGTGMVIIDEDTKITLANEEIARLTGYDLNEIIGSSWTEIVHEEDLNRMLKYHQERRKGRNDIPNRYEFRLIGKGGQEKYCILSINIIPGTQLSVGSILDITERRIMEKALRESKHKVEKLHEMALKMGRSEKEEEVYQLIIKAAEEILNFSICSVNMAVNGYFDVKAVSSGMTPDGAHNMPVTEGIGGKAFQEQKTILTEDIWAEKNAKPVKKEYRSGISSPIGNIGIFQVISTRKGAFTWEDVRLTELLLSHATEAIKRIRSEAQIRYMSFHDSLTGLYNRAFFDEELKRLNTERQIPISLILGDINGLKLVNDVFGHQRGDELLKEVARIVKDSCRKEDIVARWGGDEFAILLPETDEKVLVEICQRIRNSCLESNFDPVRPSLALGSATKQISDRPNYELIKEAEDKMYRNKLMESRSARSAIITSLEKTLWEKSYETEEHARRLQELAVSVGKALKLSDSVLDNLVLLATLHDIGKIAIPESIIKKPGPLNKDEWAVIKKHPEIGYRIALSSPELGPIAEAILAHHEWWSGTGYPHGLKEEEIPLIARIIAIVDAYDVMLNGRPYKGPVSEAEAIAELRKCAGTQFDPQLVSLFIDIIDLDGKGND